MDEPRYLTIVFKGEDTLVSIEKVGDRRCDLSSNESTCKIATDSLEMALCFAECAVNK